MFWLEFKKEVVLPHRRNAWEEYMNFFHFLYVLLRPTSNNSKIVSKIDGKRGKQWVSKYKSKYVFTVYPHGVYAEVLIDSFQ